MVLEKLQLNDINHFRRFDKAFQWKWFSFPLVIWHDNKSEFPCSFNKLYLYQWFICKHSPLLLNIWCHIIVIVSVSVIIISFLIVDLISDSALCQHAKKVCSSCGISGGGNGGGAAVSSAIKQQNGATKESKELKSKKPNWGIKLNCTKLRGIKALSSSLSSERKYIAM